MKYNKQKFDHYLEIVIDIVYCAGFIGVFTFTMYQAINHHF